MWSCGRGQYNERTEWFYIIIGEQYFYKKPGTEGVRVKEEGDV